MRVTDLIAQDHRTVRELFIELQQTSDGRRRQELLDTLVDELEVHAQAEEAVFYPAVRQVSRRIDDAEAGHTHLRHVIGDVQGRDPGSPEFLAGVRHIEQVVLAHVAEEEGGIFLDAQRLEAAELERLGAAMEERKQTLKSSLLHRGVRAVKQAAQKIA